MMDGVGSKYSMCKWTHPSHHIDPVLFKPTIWSA